MNAVCIDFVPNRSDIKEQDAQWRGVTIQPFGSWLCHGDEVSVCYTRLKPNSWPEHNHRHAELLLTFDSAQVEIMWRCGENCPKRQLVEANQFCLIPSNVSHSFDWKREANIVVVFFEESLLKWRVRKSVNGVLVGDFRPLTRLDACLWSLGAIFYDLCHKEERPSASFIEGIGTALASRTLELHFRATQGNIVRCEGLPDHVLTRVASYVDSHLQDGITVVDMARNAALSTDHFARLLKITTGSSPLQFLLRCRVEKALELLRTGKYRVGEAAFEVGFCDQSHLDRHCRKFFGFSPKTVVGSQVRICSEKCRNHPRRVK